MKKICIKCKVEKEDIKFHFKNKKLQTRNGTCKICSSKYKKKHYRNNRKKYIEKAQERNTIIREENRQKIFNFLSSKHCADCSESNILVLEFDHKDPEKKNFNVTSCLDSSWKTILKEIIKCDIRCSNCHSIKTHEQFNTHRFLYSKQL